MWSGRGSNGRLLAMVFFANIAQPVISMTYLLYNAVFTCMFAEKEWSQLAHERKSLRVSGVPKGAQRSSYFLSLPYKVSLPIITLSATLHWLVSQAIFIIAVERRGPTGVPASQDPFIANDPTGTGLNNMHVGLGWSPLALVLILFALFFTFCSVVLVGLMRYKTGPPMFAGSSAVLAAACHVQPDEDGSEVALAPVKWGVVREPSDGVPGHCALSAREVTFPRRGLAYE